MSDLLFRGCDVIDGTGAPRVRADVAVTDGTITAVGPDAAADPARRTLDVTGLVLAPGFIDMHAHSDLAVLTDPEHLAKTAQGVTLEVLGQDGLSYAPVPDEAVLTQLRTQLAGWNGDPGADRNVDTGADTGAARPFAWDWRDVAGYLGRIDRGCAVNAAYLVPQGTLRMVCVGTEDRPATDAELDAMRALLAQSLEQGAIGMSSGLTYPPGMYADTAELTDLCRVVAEYGGFYSPHHRSYGAAALEAYAEMIAVGRASGCPVHLTHATMNFPVNKGRAGELLAVIDAALAEGTDVTLDSYPYLPGATTLAALLPGWAAQGGADALMARLADPEARARMATELEVTGSDGCHGVPIDWTTIQISGVRNPELSDHVGRTVAEAAERANAEPTAFCFDLLLADRLGTSCLMHIGHEENVRAIMRHPAHLVGSDGLLTGGRPHPRGWGTFPRYLGHYVRELGLLTLEDCVAKMTGRAARRLGLADRGRIAPGLAADLVLFDPAAVADRATFDAPRQTPDGIPYVLVNGEFVIDEGRRTDALPGRAVRRRT
jgi:N-acyl-D-amino-acid deacylase